MIRRGDVLLAELGPVVGREQSGRRPVLIVSSDAMHRRDLVVMGIPGTGAERILHDYPINVRVTAAETGLAKDTVFLCFQMRALDPGRFLDPTNRRLRRLGRLPPRRMAEIDAALRLVLALELPPADAPGVSAPIS
jgi:mRNA interferase MazF